MHADETCRRIEAELTAWHQDELPPGRRAEVEAHLAECRDCARAAAEVESVFSLAGSIEDLVPSMRFRRNLAALVRRAARPDPAGAGLFVRVRFACAYLADRLRTSRRFRLATISVAVHVAVLLLVSLVLIPRVVEHREEQSREAVARYAGHPVLPDEVKVSPPAPLPPPDLREDHSPEIVESNPFPSERSLPVLPPVEPVLPARPLETPLLAGEFAIELDPAIKERRMAACLSDPAAALAGVGRGLGWLAETQQKDGSWNPGVRGEEYRTGVTAVALLAFLSDGHSETRGATGFREVVRRAVDRLLSQQQTEGEHVGLIGPARGHFAYNHALATIALIEAWMLDVRRVPAQRSADLRKAIRLAVAYIEREQVPAGAWPYGAGDLATQTDSSVAIFMGMALADARSARFHVSSATFDRLSAWLRSVTTGDGVVGYRFAGDRSSAPYTRTAGALYLEELLGLAAPVRDRQAELVGKALRDSNLTKDNGLLRFYAALAFRSRGTPVVDRFVPEMLAVQRPDGSWSSERDEWAVYGGDAFLTALNVLTLTSSFRFAG